MTRFLGLHLINSKHLILNVMTKGWSWTQTKIHTLILFQSTTLMVRSHLRHLLRPHQSKELYFLNTLTYQFDFLKKVSSGLEF